MVGSLSLRGGGNGSISEKEYDEALEPLLHELSDAARWIRKPAAAVVVSKAATPPARAARSTMFAKHAQSPPVPRRALPARRSGSAANGISSAMSNICRPRAKSACSTAAGTTGRGRDGDGLCIVRSRSRLPQGGPDFERQLVDDGIYFYKYWLCCDQEQAGRALRRSAQQSASPVEACRRSIDRRASFTTPTPRPASGCSRDRHCPRALDSGRFQRPAAGPPDLLRDLLDRLPTPSCRWRSSPGRPLDHEPIEERYGVLKTINAYAGRTRRISLSFLRVGWGGRSCVHQNY
jgi:hypothetical protein